MLKKVQWVAVGAVVLDVAMGIGMFVLYTAWK